MLRGAVLVLAAAGLGFGADFNGFWAGQVPTRNGESVDIAFQLEHKGGALTGKLYQDIGSAAISEARVAGDLVTFVVVTREQAGNQINETRMRFTGKMAGGALELTRDREASNNAGNAGNTMFRGSTKVSFTLRRL
jgi:hypothetical protein